MNWTIKHQDFLHCHITSPEFTPVNKKEEKAAERMNLFFGDIISAAMKISDENGLKYYITILPEALDDRITVVYTLRIRERGRTLKTENHTSCWKNGVIMKKASL